MASFNRFDDDSASPKLGHILSYLQRLEARTLIYPPLHPITSMSEETPPPKRRRTDDPETENRETTRRSARFWFDDGNVVLQAEDTQFRVHRSHLALHSEIMKDCFSCPQPEGAPTIEGCPLVHLPDSATDIENLCALIYGLYHIDVQGIDTSYLGTMLRMGRKYDISFFKVSALKYLRNLFPRTLEKWNVSYPEVVQVVTQSRPFLFEVINMAYENHIPSILPAAFLSMYKIWHLKIITSGFGFTSGEDRHHIMLEPSALKDCLNGRMFFMSIFCHHMLDAIDLDAWDDTGSSKYAIPCSDCTDKPKCSTRLTDLFVALLRLGVTSHPVHIPQNFLDMCDVYRSPEIGKPFCDQCLVFLQELFDAQMDVMWQQFPAYINLESWEAIKDFDV